MNTRKIATLCVGAWILTGASAGALELYPVRPIVGPGLVAVHENYEVYPGNSCKVSAGTDVLERVSGLENRGAGTATFMCPIGSDSNADELRVWMSARSPGADATLNCRLWVVDTDREGMVHMYASPLARVGGDYEHQTVGLSAPRPRPNAHAVISCSVPGESAVGYSSVRAYGVAKD